MKLNFERGYFQLPGILYGDFPIWKTDRDTNRRKKDCI